MRVEEENRLYLGKPTRFEWKNGQMMGEVIVQHGKNRCRISFVWREDEQGNLRPVDPFIVKGALDLECPQCNRKNEPILFWYDDDGSGCGSRRYFYCCPDCKIHYTSLGQHADRNSERTRIFRNCTQNGDHQIRDMNSKRLSSSGRLQCMPMKGVLNCG